MYYAILREQRGLDEEQVETSAKTAAQLYEELAAAHSFSLEASQLKVVINAQIRDWDCRITPGDSVVFLPPVAGG
jgi:molybdopterin converting factor small subunit